MLEITLLLISTLSYLGWTYSNLPAAWWQPVGMVDWLFRLLIILFSGLWCGIGAALFILIPLRYGLLKRPEISKKYLALLAPIFPALVMPLWGAYCSLQHTNELYCIFLKEADSWYTNILFESFAASILLVLLTGTYTVISYSWKNERLVALGILNSEFACSLGFLWTSLVFALRCPI